MVNVVFDELRYIPGIPLELTGEAIASGALREAKMVGVIVFSPEKPEEKACIELLLDCREQIALLAKNSVVPIEQSGVYYRMSPSWREYAGVKYVQPQRLRLLSKPAAICR